MAYTSKEFILSSIKGVEQSGDVVISGLFTSHDPRFVVVTVKHEGTTGSVELYDSTDGFATETLMQTETLAAAGGVTVLRYNAETNGLLRNQLRVKLADADAVTISSVNVCFAS